MTGIPEVLHLNCPSMPRCQQPFVSASETTSGKMEGQLQCPVCSRTVLLCSSRLTPCLGCIHMLAAYAKDMLLYVWSKGDALPGELCSAL